MLNLFLPLLISLKAISALGCFPWVAGTPNFGSSGPRSLARLHRLPRIASAPFCQCLDTSRFYITDADLVWSGGSVIGLATRIVIFYTIPVNQPLSGRIFHRRAR
jgi:hypothetical protein